MIFFRPRGHKEPAVLWDKETDRAAYEFVNGYLVTDDPKTIKLLKSKGFSTEPMSEKDQRLLDVQQDVMREQPVDAPITSDDERKARGLGKTPPIVEAPAEAPAPPAAPVESAPLKPAPKPTPATKK